jgi:hypothetical protein
MSTNNIIYNGKCGIKILKWLHVHKSSKNDKMKIKFIAMLITLMEHHQ